MTGEWRVVKYTPISIINLYNTMKRNAFEKNPIYCILTFFLPKCRFWTCFVKDRGRVGNGHLLWGVFGERLGSVLWGQSEAKTLPDFTLSWQRSCFVKATSLEPPWSSRTVSSLCWNCTLCGFNQLRDRHTIISIKWGTIVIVCNHSSAKYGTIKPFGALQSRAHRPRREKGRILK